MPHLPRQYPSRLLAQTRTRRLPISAELLKQIHYAAVSAARQSASPVTLGKRRRDTVTLSRPRATSLARTPNPSWTRRRTAATVQHADAHLALGLLSRRDFHNYFVTHLPSSSMHPDSRVIGPGHKLPRDASTPHVQSPGSAIAASPYNMPNRDLTVVRIPLQRAKHHFGAATARGTRPYNEDMSQAGTIDMPAFAKRAPISLQRSQIQRPNEAKPAESAFGDPQIFYFGVFDGHGGSDCSEFLKDELHNYIEEASSQFGLQSSLSRRGSDARKQEEGGAGAGGGESEGSPSLTEHQPNMKSREEVKRDLHVPLQTKEGRVEQPPHEGPFRGADPVAANVDSISKAFKLKNDLVQEYKQTVGGYFRRFSPKYFNVGAREEGDSLPPITLESVLMYAFLRADLDFITAQARKPDADDPDPHAGREHGDTPVNHDEILGAPHAPSPPSSRSNRALHHSLAGPSRFKGGSTASVALISTPSAAPFWHPNAQSTLIVAHVGDTRAILCETATGLAQPLTSDHHPAAPGEERRLRRFAPAGSMVSGDSFGEQRIAGLANSRAFGDMRSKRIGVSAEPELTRVDMAPAQYSFLVLVSDGVSGAVSDQEIVDVVKEASTPEQGSTDVVNYATEVSSNGDNATCLVVRLGGWERRSEGGLGSLGTKEVRDVRRAEALDPRRGRR